MKAKLPGAACEACPGRNAPIVPPETYPSVRLAVVGETPGAAEFTKSRPHIGSSGKLLMGGVRSLGLKRSNVHWTHAVPCKVGMRDLAKARKCCAGRLVAEIEASGAQVIMPVGSLGLKSILSVRSAPIMRYRGSISPVAGTPQRYVCPTIPPAIALRQPLYVPLLVRDVERIGRVLQDGWTPPELQPGRVTLYPRTERQLVEALGRLQLGDLGFDVETVGLGPTETLLVCFALSDPQTTVVVPWSRKSCGTPPWWRRPDWVAGQVSDVLAESVAITHNGPVFDHIVAARYGIRIGKWEDTLVASHAFEAHLPKGLDRVATTWLDVGPWKTWEHSKRITDLWRYNGRDTLYTILAWQAMKEHVT